MNAKDIIKNGLIKENPTWVLILGMCPTLATTTSAVNGMMMGLATAFVLLMSNIVISLLKSVIPDKVRIPAFIVVIATFVTVLQLLMQAIVRLLAGEDFYQFCDRGEVDFSRPLNVEWEYNQYGGFNGLSVPFRLKDRQI